MEKPKVMSRIPNLFLGSIIAVLLVSGCAANFAPAYDPQTASQITATYKAVTQFYIELEQVPQKQRTYKTFVKSYENVTVQIKTLLWRAENQANNKNSSDMAKRLLEDWKAIESRQKKRNSYSDVLVKIDQSRVDNLLDDLATVEAYKRKPGK